MSTCSAANCPDHLKGGTSEPVAARPKSATKRPGPAAPPVGSPPRRPQRSEAKADEKDEDRGDGQRHGRTTYRRLQISRTSHGDRVWEPFSPTTMRCMHEPFVLPASGIIGATGPRGIGTLPSELLELLEAKPAWWDDAPCREHPGVNFFPNTRAATTVQAVATAKSVCERCLVRADCLAWALAAPPTQDDGIFGGTTPAERKALRTGQAEAAEPAA